MVRMFIGLFLINLAFSVMMNYNKEYESGFYWFVNLLFPVWISILGGSIIGLFVMMFPNSETNMTKKLVRSKIIGMMIMTAILFIFYFYNLLAIMMYTK